MIQVDIKSLKPGIHTYEWTPEADELDLDPEVFRELFVTARLDFHPTRILVDIQTSALANLICDRTLKKFDEKITGTYSVLFASGGLSEDGEEKDDEILPLNTTDEEIDLTNLVRDTFILSVPARKIAPGAELEDIQFEFGSKAADGSVDPRWEVLRKFSSEGSDLVEDDNEE